MKIIAEVLNGKTDEDVLFTSKDMLYAYGQIRLPPDTKKNCNFQIVGGEATKTY